MTNISWFSDFALYLEGYFMYKHDNFDLRIKVGQCDLYFMVH